MALTYTIKATRKDADTLFVDTIFTDGVNTERVEVPHFQPKDKQQILDGEANRAKTYDAKWKAEAEVAALKPEVDKEKDKPTPVQVAIEP